MHTNDDTLVKRHHRIVSHQHHHAGMGILKRNMANDGDVIRDIIRDKLLKMITPYL